MKKQSRMFSALAVLVCLIMGCDSSHNNDRISEANGVSLPGQSTNQTPGSLTNYDPNIVPTSYEPKSCSLPDMQRFVHRVMSDSYLWYDTVPKSEGLRFEDFESLEQFLKFIKNKEKDTFSLVMEESLYRMTLSGQQLGLGISVQFDKAGALRVRYVDFGSPAANASVARGDTLLAINGKTIEELNASQLWGAILGQDQEGVNVDLKIQKHTLVDEAASSDATETASEGSKPEEPSTITLTKAVYNTPAIAVSSVIEMDKQRVGYLLMNNLTASTETELRTVFARFKSEGVSELILDLRYNPGASMLAASQLAGYIWGYGQLQSNDFAHGFHNDKHTALNWALPFSQPEDRLYLTRVFVLTGPDSCSASEAIINGLKPYLDVVQIGGITCGKPYGMYAHLFCGNVLLPLEFQIKNAQGEGEYTDGLSPNCPMDDDLEHILGDTKEALLEGALHYIASGQCASPAGKSTPLTSIPLPGSQSIQLYHGIHQLSRSF